MIAGKWPAPGVDGGRGDEPRVPVDPEGDVPAVVMDLGVAALTEQASVVQVGGAAISPVHDVVDLGV